MEGLPIFRQGKRLVSSVVGARSGLSSGTFFVFLADWGFQPITFPCELCLRLYRRNVLIVSMTCLNSGTFLGHVAFLTG